MRCSGAGGYRGQIYLLVSLVKAAQQCCVQPQLHYTQWGLEPLLICLTEGSEERRAVSGEDGTFWVSGRQEGSRSFCFP